MEVTRARFTCSVKPNDRITFSTAGKFAHRREERFSEDDKARKLILLVVVAHWTVAVTHLFLAAKILPAPGNRVSWLAVILITSGHVLVSIALWKLSDKLAALVSLIFFFAALGADLYEHFLHASANNIFMAARGDWASWFDASVFALLALEIVGCLLGIRLLGRTRNNSQPLEYLGERMSL